MKYVENGVLSNLTELGKMKFSPQSTKTSYVALRFDKESTDYIRLMQERVANYLELKPLRYAPHITLTDWRGSRNELYDKLNYFCEDYQQFTFCFWNVGSFEGTQTVYIEPKSDRWLRTIQFRLVRALGQPKSEYLSPGLWNPHCTIAKGIKKSMLKYAEVHVTASFNVFDCTALGFEVLTKGEDSMFVKFGGCG